MKLRIKGNSLRLRLSKTEIKNFGELGIIEERTEFPNGKFFQYTLERKPGIDNLEGAFYGNCISVFVPEEITAKWVNSDMVGFEHRMDMGDGKELFLLIEKDFVCLDQTSEDQKDNFPNPNKGH